MAPLFRKYLFQAMWLGCLLAESRHWCRMSCPYASQSQNLELLPSFSVSAAKDSPAIHLKDRLVSAAPVEDDSSFELKLRPQRLAEFIGQAKVKENLDVAIQAAKSRGEALDHVLLYGPPGLGKTTLANIIANELAVAFQQPRGPRCRSRVS